MIHNNIFNVQYLLSEALENKKFRVQPPHKIHDILVRLEQLSKLTWFGGLHSQLLELQPLHLSQQVLEEPNTHKDQRTLPSKRPLLVTHEAEKPA